MRPEQTKAIVLVLLLFPSLAPGQGKPSDAQARNRAASVSKLSTELRWREGVSREEYERTKADVTRRLLGEIDALIQETFRPEAAIADRVKTSLDGLLGYNQRGLEQNAVFYVNLPAGRFLIVGVELLRGGGAIAEDAISFRAYRASGNAFVFAAAIDDLGSSSKDNPYLTDLYAKPVTSCPFPGEFCFLALAMVPPRSPYTFALRLYAFDGERFRTLWAPEDIIAWAPEKAVELSAGGFTVNRLFDPTGVAALSPTVVIHEQYTISTDGVHKVAEWQTGDK